MSVGQSQPEPSATACSFADLGHPDRRQPSTGGHAERDRLYGAGGSEQGPAEERGRTVFAPTRPVGSAGFRGHGMTCRDTEDQIRYYAPARYCAT